MDFPVMFRWQDSLSREHRNGKILLLFYLLVLKAAVFLLSIRSVLSCCENLVRRQGEIKTPYYPDGYGDNLNCTWTIQVDKYESIKVTFWDFQIEMSPQGGCADNFYVFDGPDRSSQQLLNQTCGDSVPAPLFSSGNVLMLVLSTDEKTVKKGVHLLWRVADKFTISQESKTWQEANAACMNEGGHLAVKNDLNSTLLLKRKNEISANLWIGDYFTPWIWLLGCYIEEKQRHNLSVSYQSKENEAKVCQHICRDSVYFGLQNEKCFCLTADNLETLTISEYLHCKLRCPGNDKERCGGTYGFTVYMNDVCWKNSTAWTAKISKTISARSCQPWASNEPHAHIYHEDYMFPDGSEAAASNYCRDPDGKGAPWCFTTDKDVPWQFCDAPPCPDTCWKDPIQYRGTLNITFDGKKCINWKNGTPKYHNASLYPDSTVEKARNYCRSPNNDPCLWCFIPPEIPGTDKLQYCGTPPCFGSNNNIEFGELCRVYWSEGSKVYSEERKCQNKEYFSCFYNVGSIYAQTQPDSARFYDAMNNCTYGLINYKLLFVNITQEDQRNKLWLANFRNKDDVYNKDGLPTPSACMTTQWINNEFKNKYQANCSSKFGYVCKIDAILCGEKFKNNKGNITSPGYPSGYDDKSYCVWEIEVSEGRSISLSFIYIDIEDFGNCSSDYVEVLEKKAGVTKSLMKTCGIHSKVNVSPTSNQVIVKFKSDKSVSGSGFELEWKSEFKSTSPAVDTELLSTTAKASKEVIPTTTFSISSFLFNVTASSSTATNGRKATGSFVNTRNNTTSSSPNEVIPTTTFSISSFLFNVTASSSTATNGRKATGSFVNTRNNTTSSSPNAGVYAGIAIGVLLAVTVVILVIYLFYKRRTTVTTKGTESFQLQRNIQTNEENTYSVPNNIQNQRPSEKNICLADDNNYDHLNQTKERLYDQSASGKSFKYLIKPDLYDLYDHANAAEAKLSDDAYDHLAADKQESAMTVNGDDADHEYSTTLATSQTDRLNTEYSYLKNVTKHSGKRFDNAVKDNAYDSLSSAGAINQRIMKKKNTSENNQGDKEYDHLHITK